MGELIVPLVFFGVIAGFVTLGVGLNVFQKWAKHRFMARETEDRFMALEERMAELEERADFTERVLTEAKSRRHLES
ncbi:MAG: hypothetical protein ACE5HT_16520 [Gemmatimonadales bacterium]